MSMFHVLRGPNRPAWRVMVFASTVLQLRRRALSDGSETGETTNLWSEDNFLPKLQAATVEIIW